MKKIIFILFAVLLVISLYLNYKFVIYPRKESARQSVESPEAAEPLSSAVLPEAEKAQMFTAAREYIKPDCAEGMEVDLKILKQLDSWVLLEIIPLNVETDNAAMVLEKVNGEWRPRDWGTILPGWRERVPELFE